jgi:hypothetical protein
MKNLILLNKTIDACGHLIQVCSQVSVHGVEPVEEDQKGHLDELTDAMSELLILMSFLGHEYDIDVEDMQAEFPYKAKRIERDINELLPESHEESDDDDQCEQPLDTPHQSDTPDQTQKD